MLQCTEGDWGVWKVKTTATKEMAMAMARKLANGNVFVSVQFCNFHCIFSLYVQSRLEKSVRCATSQIML